MVRSLNVLSRPYRTLCEWLTFSCCAFRAQFVDQVIGHWGRAGFLFPLAHRGEDVPKGLFCGCGAGHDGVCSV